MTPPALAVLALGVLLAFVNGANDVSKGIATLAGSGVSDYRRAIRWGAIWTAAGGLVGASAAGAMLETFGKGLLEPGTTWSFSAALATILGAAASVLIATRTGLPVSTTHAILGAIGGVGIAAYGPRAVCWGTIGEKIALPLLLSPLVSFSLTVVLFRLDRRISGTPRGAAADCLCAEVEPARIAVAVTADASSHASALVPVGARLRLRVAPSDACPSEKVAMVRLTLDPLHWLTSGATSFARGLNDAPKIVASVLAAAALSSGAPLHPMLAFAAVTAGMVAGSLAGGRRVTHVLAERLTRMDHREGFGANLVTSLLVAAGAVGGLPMSTTHVSSAAIVGAGIERGPGALHGETVRNMALAWVATLPVAALFGALCVWVFP